MENDDAPFRQSVDACHRQRVLYCRIPSLLIRVAQRRLPAFQYSQPLAVMQDRLVRAVCDRAASAGVHVGQSITQARRLCPALVLFPLDVLDCHLETTRFLDILADTASAVEPDGPDAAYVAVPRSGLCAAEQATDELSSSFGPVISGWGISRLAARACAECALPASRFTDASVDWLWPDDPRVAAALRRLGLETFGQVATVGEGALFYQFGKIGRLLHRRSLGQDLTPVRPLYPPSRADARLDLSESPISLRGPLEAALTQVSLDVVDELRALCRHGRRVVLRIATEVGEHRREAVLPSAIQRPEEVQRAAAQLFSRMSLTAPVTGMRLLVEGLEIPAARTNDLFLRGPGDDPVALEAVRRSLEARFGKAGVTLLSHRPQTAREGRRACLREKWQAYR